MSEERYRVMYLDKDGAERFRPARPYAEAVELAERMTSAGVDVVAVVTQDYAMERIAARGGFTIKDLASPADAARMAESRAWLEDATESILAECAKAATTPGNLVGPEKAAELRQSTARLKDMIGHLSVKAGPDPARQQEVRRVVLEELGLFRELLAISSTAMDSLLGNRLGGFLQDRRTELGLDDWGDEEHGNQEHVKRPGQGLRRGADRGTPGA